MFSNSYAELQGCRRSSYISGDHVHTKYLQYHCTRVPYLFKDYLVACKIFPGGYW